MNYLSLTQWETDWAIEKMAAPPLDVTEEEVKAELELDPDDRESLLETLAAIQLQSLSSL